jgi:tRNA(adenine34) deaminase
VCSAFSEKPGGRGVDLCNEQIGRARKNAMTPGATALGATASAMALALIEAAVAAEHGEVPVGAVLLDPTGTLVAASGNRVERDRDPTAHAEMLVLRRSAARLGAKRLAGCDLYVTLEPCPMCAAAIGLSRIRRLYFGAYDPKGGGVEHGARIFDQPTCHHRPEFYGGIAERAAGDLLRCFFAARR